VTFGSGPAAGCREPSPGHRGSFSSSVRAAPASGKIWDMSER
jgi:hypothetical protein